MMPMEIIGMCPYCKRGVTKDLQPVNNPNETLAQKMTSALEKTDPVDQHYLNMTHEREEKKKSELKCDCKFHGIDHVDQSGLIRAHEREEQKKSELKWECKSHGTDHVDQRVPIRAHEREEENKYNLWEFPFRAHEREEEKKFNFWEYKSPGTDHVEQSDPRKRQKMSEFVCECVYRYPSVSNYIISIYAKNETDRKQNEDVELCVSCHKALVASVLVIHQKMARQPEATCSMCGGRRPD
ncbi:uncharacterized protein LOC117186463 [Drosophila miranda]|uniref:uncharacterized protein LOC117186463 n=1 Tax=Drosophila miranda TaxID=7229 RepID=UPI00143F0712|nr:uncharacterized protein LOC117186463 [Drosophila miranda]